MLAAFTEQTGYEVVYNTYDTTEELRGIATSNVDQYDVIVADGNSAEMLHKGGVFAPLAKERIPNLANISERWLGLPFDPENTYTAPYLWGTTLVAYNSALIPDPEPSCHCSGIVTWSRTAW